MVSKLKARYGSQYSSKLEGMLNDMDTSNKMSDEYRAHLVRVPQAVEFVPRVLTVGYWPTFPTHVFGATLPPEMVACTSAFAAYYAERGNSHRQLTWPLSAGKVAVLFANDKGVKFELTVIPLQAAVLMHFNGVAGTTPYAAVRDALGLKELVANRILHSLACTKTRVLTKTGAATKVADGDAFGVAGAFTATARKITVQPPPLEEKASTDTTQDRSYVVDACLVRTMKARRNLAHPDLVAEVLAQLHFFRPEPAMIKKRIEFLIEREYLERDPDNAAVYRYLA